MIFKKYGHKRTRLDEIKYRIGYEILFTQLIDSLFAKSGIADKILFSCENSRWSKIKDFFWCDCNNLFEKIMLIVFSIISFILIIIAIIGWAILLTNGGHCI
jgi:hypothetical protein